MTPRLALVFLGAIVVPASDVSAQNRAGGGRPGGGRFQMPDPVMVALDANLDRELSAEEMAGAAAALAELDKNGDGNITTDELTPQDQGGRGRGPGFGGMMRMSPILSALDLDGDGELFEDEVTDASVALARLDEDGNGRLTGAEIATSFGGFGGFGGARGGRAGFGSGPGGRGGFDPGGGATVTLEPSEVEFNDGAAEIPDRDTFRELSYQGADVLIDIGLTGLEFVKFTVTGVGTDDTKIYFVNTETHRAHMMFAAAVGIPGGGLSGGSGQMRGVLTYRPLLTSPTGSPGLYTFEFEPFDSFSFDWVRTAYELLGHFAPIVEGNLAYYPLEAAIARYEEERAQYEAEDLPVFFSEDVYRDIAFLPLHHAAGFGRLRLMTHGERPGVRDIVIYPTLPNEMPRVAGIITGARQTPLSHVNLRAIQDDVPNAFIQNASDLSSIRNLIGKYVRYEVMADGYDLREVSAGEVEEHFASLRPSNTQVPPRDLSVTNIRSLDVVGFADAPSVGVKSANLSAMRKFGLPEGAVPVGLAVPFFYYDTFMRHNDLYVMAAQMMEDAGFRSDASTREAALEKFQDAVENGSMPESLRRALGAAQSAFGGAPIRARSSTNNEDLPGFSGAGLYESFTHRPDEGHLEKSIKQVYASLWGFRAYEERDFYRIDHMATAMGVLLQLSVSDERANGVAVTEDIVYQTANQGIHLYYVNAQLGENLVTNPENQAIPEEILLAPRNPRSDQLIQSSSLVPAGTQILSDDIRLQLRRYLRVIHKEFQTLYEAPEDQPFAMEVEFKVLQDGRLSVKQARPWVY